MEAKIILVLMVKNESAILQRCLAAAAPFCDAIVVADTGSTDATLEIAMEFSSSDTPMRVVTDEWKNFGWNRSLSLKAARACAEELT
jgi:glycosyltransferase involved in cell wall biosynthesis